MGRVGPLKVVGVVAWQLKYDVLAMAVVAALLLPVPDDIQMENSVAALSVLGIAASIFIGFRNTTAYNRWWEARTLWGAIINDSRAWHNNLTSVDSGNPSMSATLDRMRRRQVRYAWKLAAELRGVAPPPGVVELTGEDPPQASATDLLNLQAHDVQTLSAGGHIDFQARVMLMSVNTTLAASQGGLERIRNQPVPVHYDLFIRAMTWFFAIVAFNRFDAQLEPISLVLGLLVMLFFIVAERLGYFIERPMCNRIFDLPMYRFCSTITGNLLGAGHPLAAPRESEKAVIWM
ncbi:MAG: bestrophin family ion channel [Mycolicibacterium sp.]|uniref:bestrophin family ion channel n=1 Tax=Mycolicibacterium sp. TaxID=2320850 RepID=UPI003D13E64F